MRGKINFFLTICLLIIIETTARPSYKFKLLYEWKQIEYNFASEKERSAAIANGTFREAGVQPIDVQYVYDENSGSERTFITTPRVVPGVPATLGIVTNKTRNGNPIIQPYPSWSWQINPEKCNYHRLVSVYRVWADECGRLWVIDTGVLLPFPTCPPQILAFDLKTNKLLYKYELPYNQHQNVSWYVAPVAEVESTKNKCINTWVYVADCRNSSLLVYSLKQNKSWRIQDESFNPDPRYRNYTIDGDSFQVPDGIVTVALTPKDSQNNRKLRYHAGSNIKESWIYTKYLKDPSNFKKPYSSPQLFNTYRGRRDQQSSAEAIDKHGYVYFSLVIDVLLVKWDPKTEYTRRNFEIVSDDKKRMTFPSGLKVGSYRGSSCEGLFIFATAYQRICAGTLTGNVTNFRLFFTEL